MPEINHLLQKLNINLHNYAEGFFSIDDVQHTFYQRPQTIPHQFEAEIAKLLEERDPIKRSEDNIRVLSYGLPAGKLRIDTAPATFASFITINKKHLPEALQITSNPFNIEEVPVPLLAANATVLTEDDKIIFVKRSQEVATYKGFYHSGVGGYCRQSHRYNGEVHPFATYAKELEEELGYTESTPKDFHAFSLVRNLDDYHLDLLGEVGLHATSKELLELKGDDEYENEGKFSMDFNLDILTKLRRTDWVPVGFTATLHSLANAYGISAVERILSYV